MRLERTCIVIQDYPGDALRAPEQLVDIVVSDDVSMVLLPTNKLSVDSFITLITDETVEGFNDCPQVKALLHRLEATLALGGSVVIVCALENEAQAFGYKANLGGLSPTKEVQSNLPYPIVLAHVFHDLSPSLSRIVGGLDGSAEPSKGRALNLARDIVKVELGGEIPFTVVGIVTTDIVSMECEKCLIWRHSGCPRVEKLHGEIELVGG